MPLERNSGQGNGSRDQLVVCFWTNATKVFIDGSVSQYGESGIGVHWPTMSERDIASRAPGIKGDSNQAELAAARVAMNQARQLGISALTLCTDSEFVLQQFQEGNLQAPPGVDVNIQKVAAHQRVAGNVMADRLARQGSGVTQTGR